MKENISLFLFHSETLNSILKNCYIENYYKIYVQAYVTKKIAILFSFFF